MPVFDDPNEGAAEVLGVPGRWARTTKPGQAPGLWFQQKFITESRRLCVKRDEMIRASIRFDDGCGNGHNTFSITADILGPARKIGSHYSRQVIGGGCCHDEIAKAFPEFDELIPFHLCSSDGPMHYPSNALYFAGNRDHWGKLEGEPRAFAPVIRFGSNPIAHRFDTYKEGFVTWLESVGAPFDLEVIRIDHDKKRDTFGPKFTFGGYADKWHECPFESERAALDFLAALQTCSPRFEQVATAWGEGKPREFDKARAAAIWPEASEADLSLPRDLLKSVLEARLPDLLAKFRDTMTGAGFYFSTLDAPHEGWRAGT